MTSRTGKTTIFWRGYTTVGMMQVHICNEPDAGRDNDNQRCGGFVVNFSERLCKVLIFFMVRR
jgi:hypothetical protein